MIQSLVTSYSGPQEVVYNRGISFFLLIHVKQLSLVFLCGHPNL